MPCRTGCGAAVKISPRKRYLFTDGCAHGSFGIQTFTGTSTEPGGPGTTLSAMQFTLTHSAPRLGAAVLVAAMALGLGGHAHAQWKWRDKNDRVQYSDVPPPSSVPDKDILQRPNAQSRRAVPVAAAPAPSGASAPALAASGPVKSVDPELEARRKKAEQEELAKRKAEEDRQKAARADNCARAKSNMALLESGQRMARITASGEREVFDDKIRAEETKRMREIIASDCAAK